MYCLLKSVISCWEKSKLKVSSFLIAFQSILEPLFVFVRYCLKVLSISFIEFSATANFSLYLVTIFWASCISLVREELSSNCFCFNESLSSTFCSPFSYSPGPTPKAASIDNPFLFSRNLCFGVWTPLPFPAPEYHSLGKDSKSIPLSSEYLLKEEAPIS